MRFRFGKYKGHDIQDVPRDYLEWLITTYGRDIKYYQAELERRDALEDTDLSIAERLVSYGYRTLASRLHPDVGGDNNAMKELNCARDYIMEYLRDRER